MDLGMTPIRDTNGTLISIVFDVDKYRVANYNINLFSKEAKDYIFSKFPRDLSSLEKELLWLMYYSYYY